MHHRCKAEVLLVAQAAALPDDLVGHRQQPTPSAVMELGPTYALHRELPKPHQELRRLQRRHALSLLLPV